MDHINPPTHYDGDPHGVSHATVDRRSGLVFVSGQVAWDMDMKVTAPDVAGQTRHALAKLKTVLEAAGSSVDRVLQLRVYIRGELGDHMAAVMPILTGWLGTARPALTGIGVASLATPETLVEIEATATVA